MVQGVAVLLDKKTCQLNGNTRVCEENFMNESTRLLRPDQVPTLGLPGSVKQNQPRSHLRIELNCLRL